MQGQITKYRQDIGVGIIAAEDGRKYRFTQSALRNAAVPPVGEDVDFLLVASRAADIFVLTGSPWTAFGPARGV